MMPPVTRRRGTKRRPEDLDDIDDGWTVIDGRRYFVAGYTPGGAPYGIFEDEMLDEPPDTTCEGY